MKDFVFKRTRAFNCVHLAEYIINKFEVLVVGRLLDIAHSRRPSNNWLKGADHDTGHVIGQVMY